MQKVVKKEVINYFNKDGCCWLSLYTGAGKTFTAATFVYRLLKHADAKRMLVVVDTKNLGEQAEQEAARIDALKAQRDRLVLGQEQQIESAQKDVLRNIQGMRLQGAQAAAQDGRARQQAGAQNIASGIALGAQTFASGLNPYGGEKTTDPMLKKVQNRGVESLGGALMSKQPQFREVRLDSQGRDGYSLDPNFDYSDPVIDIRNPFILPEPGTINYAALGYLGGNN